MTEQASLVVRGEVLSSQFEERPELRRIRVLTVKIRVDEVLKGTASSTYTFRQVVLPIARRAPENPYLPGQRVLLLLNAPNASGYSNTIGLEQGRFILSGRGDLAMAVNGRNNRGLLDGMDTAALSPELRKRAARRVGGPIPVRELTRAVRAVAAVER